MPFRASATYSNLLTKLVSDNPMCTYILQQVNNNNNNNNNNIAFFPKQIGVG